MSIRWSASTYGVYENCKFRLYCKLTDQKKDEDTDSSYGDAGNAVHHTLEEYYNGQEDLEKLKLYFNSEWDSFDIQNPVIKKDLYWLCVINGIKLDIGSPTHLEYKFRIDDGTHNYLGFADVMDNKKHIIGDWKTSTYKAAKLVGYKRQLSFYAWAYYKEFGVVPTVWVYFNKVNKKFTYEFPEADIKRIGDLMVEADKDIASRMKDMRFERQSSRTNCYFCPYKGVCSGDLLRESKAKVFDVAFHLKKNKLLIEGSIPDIIHRKIEKNINFEIKNAHFVKQAMAARGIKYDGIKRLYRRKEFGSETLIGYMNQIYQILKEYAHGKGMRIKLRLKDYRDQEALNNTIKPADKLNVPFELYKFQKDAVIALIKSRWGIVEVGTGGGKTVIAAEAIRQVGMKTLFVIDSKDLLLQTKKEYEEMLGIECGIVGMGYREWDKPVVLATIQTLSKDVKAYASKLAEFPMVVYDETHIIAAKSFETLSKHLINTKYRFGFSATPRRDDGNDNVIYAHTGTVVYKKNAQELIKENVLVDPQATFYKYGGKLTVSDNWQNEYSDGIVDSDLRNNTIKKIAEEFLAKGKQVMILTKMIRHGEWFKDNIKGADLIYGKTKDEARVEVLEDFKTGKLNCLIGNLKIFNKGINIKNLDVLINAAGNAGEVLTVQTIGRVLRKNPGKTEAFYIDFMDVGEYLHPHSMSRIAALKDQSYNVEIKDL